ncbi:Methylenetetrahydrofolate reductase 2 [Grifola frondosa]|uniref:Methylenetetrahydrofolate reductase 2 n=1 Tax=Grifola frondosa TaxID=5627 RepID=A0A1C7LLQ6_GRIFR|nr:Methylenetetrahydrofolate reductase 2 [Grifola frondosa]
MDIPLSSLFHRALTTASKAFNLPTIEDDTQELISALSDLLLVNSRVSALSLFSTNEQLSDIATRDLIYLLVPFAFAEVESRARTVDMDERLQRVVRAQTYLRTFTASLETHEIVPESEKVLYAQRTSSVNDPTKRRELKIRQYKQEKDIRTKIDAVRKRRNQNLVSSEPTTDFELVASLLPDPVHVSSTAGDEEDDADTEDILREATLLLLRLTYAQAHTQLESMEQELELLRNAPPPPPSQSPLHDPRAAKERETSDMWRLDAPLPPGGPDGKGPLLDSTGKPLRPFTILPAGASDRARLQGQVFQSDHRLPTMSVDEYLKIEAQRGNIISGDGPQSESQLTTSEQLALDAEMEVPRLGFENLLSRISRLLALNPLAITVTWVWGTTKERSLDLAGEEGGCRVADAKERGIQNILALRGDPPRGEEYWIPTDPRFTHGIDLVTYIKSSPEFSSDFCIGVAAYPDGHPDKDKDEEGELNYLKAKIDAGAEFIITQLFYDVEGFLRWVKKVREKGIQVPIIPGIMPIQTYASFLRVTKLCGTRVPSSLMSDLVPIRHDDQKVKDYGVQLAVDMIKRLTTEGDIRGVHFCTLNLEKSVTRVLEALAGLAEDTEEPPESERIITPHTATDTAATKLATSGPNTEVEAGKGELNSAADWDDFPNGRFGDFKSPAYGETDPWVAFIPRLDLASASARTVGVSEDRRRSHGAFLRHIHSKLATTPFSHTPLSPESLLIFPHLERLTRKGWWTVGSQPAIDGASSMDEVVGWGPRGGYVYQKCFVEFFVEKQDAERIVQKVEQEGQGLVSYFAGNVLGECLTNVPEGERNAVTWVSFPARKLHRQPSSKGSLSLHGRIGILDLAEWASFYPPDSEERRLLESVRNERWLVSIIHHDYMDPAALWHFLFKGTPLV